MAVSAAKLERAGIDDKFSCGPMADGVVSMAVNQAVGIRKVREQAGFDVHAVPAELIAMGQSDLERAECKF